MDIVFENTPNITKEEEQAKEKKVSKTTTKKKKATTKRKSSTRKKPVKKELSNSPLSIRGDLTDSINKAIENNISKEVAEENKKRELQLILDEIEARKAKYSIVSTTLDRIPQQVRLLNDMKTRLEQEFRPRYFLYYGWNGAGKSFCWAYITVLLALWQTTKKYKLPYIWAKKNIWVLTKSGSNVKTTIEPYLLGEGSGTRIPPEQIEKVTRDNGILKEIKLFNGCSIKILTYDQGRENIQGGTPDFMWLDEEPVNEDVVWEILARTRNKDCEMLVTMTPLSGLTRIYEFFFNAESRNVKNASRVYLVSSLDNPFIDHTWTEGMTEEEYRLRVLGSFESPTWLVYNQFHRGRCVIPHIEPETLWDYVEYYRSIDFGVAHPTGVVFIAKDEDGNIYVWDEVYWSNLGIEEIASKIKSTSWKREFEWTMRDSAAKREWLELERFGIKCRPADKHSKGENDMSNRKSGILLINQLLKDRKLIISSKCVNLIKEFETHYYKEGGKKDWEVNKTNDDLLDALRYAIFALVPKNKPTKTIQERKIEKEIMKTKYNGNMKWIGFSKRTKTFTTIGATIKL